eukprot:jgi/Botrbrau1/3830/Bobra.0183s0056.2
MASEKEKRADERRRQAEVKRKEKEMIKAIQLQEKVTWRHRSRGDGHHGPKDDLDFEFDSLTTHLTFERYGPNADAERRRIDADLKRPAFPPASLNLQPAFPPEIGAELGGELLVLWSALHTFSSLLGLWPCTVDEIVEAVLEGQGNRLLGEIHVALLRLLQADMEESHATGAIQGGAVGNYADRAVVNSATRLEEAWAWGFDVDAWRAHLNALTWPEVLREFAITAGLGRKRPRVRRETRPKMGTEGEDVVVEEGGGLKLKMPTRYGPGTVKAAAWQVLTEAGPQGLPITEITRRIQESGLRDLRTSRTPEASVVGALSRDVIFARVAPSTYALQAMVTHHLKQQAAAAEKASKEAANTSAEKKAPDVKQESGKQEADIKQEGEGNGKKDAGNAKSEDKPSDGVVVVKADDGAERSPGPHDDDEDESEDEFEEHPGQREEGAAWVRALEVGEYGDLAIEQRVAILSTLVHLALDGPSVRATLEQRLEEVARVRRFMWEEAKAEKRRRAAADAKRAEAALLETKKKIHALTGEPMDEDLPESNGLLNGQIGEEDEISNALASKQRAAHRAAAIRKAEEAFPVRNEPLGMDRRYNKYWRFVAAGDCGADPGAGRVYIELPEEGKFLVVDKADSLNRLLESMERRGPREGHLYIVLNRHRESLLKHMPAPPIRMPLSDDEQPPSQERQLKEAERKVWLMNTNLLAPTRTGDSGGIPSPFRAGESERLSKLKGDMLRVEAGIPRKALVDPWMSDRWRKEVRNAIGPEDLRGALATLEDAIYEEYLSPLFNRKPLLVKGAWLPTGQEVASALPGINNEVQLLLEQDAEDANREEVVLGWLPPTIPAVSLRLYALDAAILYTPGSQPGRETLEAYKYTQRPGPRVPPEEGGAVELDMPQSSKMVSGQPLVPGGRSRNMGSLKGQRSRFALPVEDVRQQVADAEQHPERAHTGGGRQRGRLGGRGAGRGRGSGRGGRGRGGRGAGAPPRKIARIEVEDDGDDEDDDDGPTGFSSVEVSDAPETPESADEAEDMSEDENPGGDDDANIEISE